MSSNVLTDGRRLNPPSVVAIALMRSVFKYVRIVYNLFDKRYIFIHLMATNAFRFCWRDFFFEKVI